MESGNYVGAYDRSGNSIESCESQGFIFYIDLPVPVKLFRALHFVSVS